MPVLILCGLPVSVRRRRFLVRIPKPASSHTVQSALEAYLVSLAYAAALPAVTLTGDATSAGASATTTASESDHVE